MATTIYDIKLRILLEDRARRSADQMSASLDRTARSAGFLERSFKSLATVAAAGFFARAATRSLVGFNAEMEQMRLTMAGMINMSTDTAWTDSIKLAGDLTERLQERAKKSVGTTKDMVMMASMVSQQVMAAGGSMKELEDIAAATVVAAKALGVQSEVAARDIDQAIRGQFRSVDQLTGKLLGALGFVGEEGRRTFNQLEVAQRKAFVLQALTQPAIAKLAAAQEQSFSGVFSTLQDNLQIFLGKVGLPLFKEITKEISSWNKWIESNEVVLQRVVSQFSKGLVAGFDIIKDAVTFFIENKDTLLAVAKVWLALKVGRMATGFAAQALTGVGRATKVGAAGLLGAGFDKVGLSTAKAGSSMLSLATTISGRLIPGIGLAIAAFEGLSLWWDRTKRSREEAEAAKKRVELDEAIKNITQAQQGRDVRLFTKARLGRAAPHELAELTGVTRFAAVRKRLLELGVPQERIEELKGEAARKPLTKSEQFSLALANKALAETDQELLESKRALADFAVREGLLVHTRQGWEIDNIRIQQDVRDAQNRNIKSWKEASEALFQLERDIQSGRIDLEKLFGIAPKEPEVALGASSIPLNIPTTMAEKPKVNVTINRIEVVSDDPDRIAFGLVSAFRDMAANPSGAIGQLVEG